MRNCICLLVFIAVAFTCAIPTSADPVCAAANLSTILGSSCDVGPLQLTFTSLFAEYNMTNNGTGQVLDDVEFPASDFYLTPTGDGFALTLLSGPQLLTESQDLHAGEDIFLSYDLAILDPGVVVTGETVSSPSISASGSSYSNVTIDGWTTADYWSQIYGGTVVSDVAGITGTHPYLYPFNDGANNALWPGSSFSGVTGIIMGADNGNVAYWSDSIDVSFTTAPVAEPSSILMLSTGLLGLAILSWIRANKTTSVAA